MVTVVIVIALIAGLIFTDAILDYLFLLIYALAVVAIINNLIHLSRYYRKFGKLFRKDITSSLLYLLMAAGAAAIQLYYFT